MSGRSVAFRRRLRARNQTHRTFLFLDAAGLSEVFAVPKGSHRQARSDKPVNDLHDMRWRSFRNENG
ncbi:MAG: hypothetical protein WA820_30590, partial [Bradyrhizobium sp.]